MRLIPAFAAAALVALAVPSIAAAQDVGNGTPQDLPTSPASGGGEPEEATGASGLYAFLALLLVSAFAVLGLLVIAFVAWRSPR